jgi:hypothetical protein
MATGAMFRLFLMAKRARWGRRFLMNIVSLETCAVTVKKKREN